MFTYTLTKNELFVFVPHAGARLLFLNSYLVRLIFKPSTILLHAHLLKHVVCFGAVELRDFVFKLLYLLLLLTIYTLLGIFTHEVNSCVCGMLRGGSGGRSLGWFGRNDFGLRLGECYFSLLLSTLLDIGFLCEQCSSCRLDESGSIGE